SSLSPKQCTILENLPLFNEELKDCLPLLLKQAKTKEFSKGNRVFNLGDDANYYYIILEGWVKSYLYTTEGKEAISRLSTTGDCFGEAAVLQRGCYTYYAESLSPTLVCYLEGSTIRTLAKTYPSLMMSMFQASLNQAEVLHLHAEHMANLTTSQRIGCFFLKLCRQSPHSPITEVLPFDKNTLATYLGMTPETFSRSLKSLSYQGVKMTNTEVFISYSEQLKSFVCSHCSKNSESCLTE
ncbi:MAG: Crp/Fnr family transcriptional regulator, partial [Burkholderiales bacterium]